WAAKLARRTSPVPSLTGRGDSRRIWEDSLSLMGEGQGEGDPAITDAYLTKEVLQTMDEAAKKTALRMIPYGMFVLTSKAKTGDAVSAGTVNWITQASFAPPLVAVGIKGDSTIHAHVKE